MDDAPAGVSCVNIDKCSLAVEMMHARQREIDEKLASKPRSQRRRRNGDAKLEPSAPPALTYQVMDACKMTFSDASFDMVFEKGA